MPKKVDDTGAYLPSPKEIKASCKAIQSKWSAKDEERRRPYDVEASRLRIHVSGVEMDAERADD